MFHHTEANKNLPQDNSVLLILTNGWRLLQDYVTGEKISFDIRNMPESIESLDLSGKQLGHKAIPILLQILAAISKSIKSLNLSNNSLYLKVNGELAKILAAVPTVRSLNLSLNCLGNQTVSELIRASAAIPASIEILDLSMNHLEDKTGEELSRIISSFQAYATVLNGTITGDARPAAINQASIKTLNLSGNILGCKTTAELIQILKAMPKSVTSLNLSDNMLGYKATEELMQILAAIPQSIRSIELTNNLFCCKKTEELARISTAIPKWVKKINFDDNMLGCKTEKGFANSLKFLIHMNNENGRFLSENLPFFKLLINTRMPEDVGTENIKKYFFKIKDNMNQINSWLNVSSEILPIHATLSDLLLDNVKHKQLQKQQKEAGFISNTIELRKQLKKFGTPNYLETAKKQAMKHISKLEEKNNKIDDLLVLLKSCLEPHIFLNLYRPGKFYGPTKYEFLLQKITTKIKELNLSIIQYEILSEYKEICQCLINIMSYYVSYEKQFSDAYNSQPSDEREHKLRVMCEPRYILGMSSSCNYACDELINHLAPTKVGQVEIFSSEISFGTHIVREYGGIHFKYHTDELQCFPAVEYIVGSLYNILAGASYGTAPTEIVKLYPSYDGIKIAKPQIFIASQSVEGINLDLFLSRHAHQHPEYLQKFDLYSFSAMVITSLLSNPADGKADNYIVRIVPSNDNNFNVKIVGIDNDLSFANPRIKKHTGSRSGQHFIEVKSIFYFFPQMEEKIHPALFEHLTNTSIELLIMDFIESLQKQDQYYKELKDSGLLTEPEWKSLRLPICFPEKNSLVSIYHKLVKIRLYLIKNKNSNHAMLFNMLYPDMFSYYQKISTYNPENTSDAMAILKKFNKIYAASAPSLEEYNIIIDGKNKRLMSKLAIKTMKASGYLDKFYDYSLADAVEMFIKAINFTNITSIDLQRAILVNLTKLDFLERLELLNCQGLDDSLLIELTTSLTKLKSIHLIGCNNASLHGIQTAYNYLMSANKPYIGISKCLKITAKEYKQIADMHIPLELLANDSNNEYYGFTWEDNASASLYHILSHASNLSLSIEQMKFLKLNGLDINGYNPAHTALNGYTALHIATVNGNLTMLRTLIAIGACPQKVDKNSSETPLQKAEKRKLFMPYYQLSKVTPIDENKKRENLAHMAATNIQRNYRALKHINKQQ